MVADGWEQGSVYQRSVGAAVELLLAIAVHRVDSVRLSKTKEVSKAATKIHGEGSAPIWRRPH